MSYRYLDDLSRADIAFEAEGTCLDDLFESAWEALLTVMVPDPMSLEAREERTLVLEEENVEWLLHGFLERLLYHRDAECLLLRIQQLRASEIPCRVHATLVGESVDPRRHATETDIKAVTWHRFGVSLEDGLWRATVVLDV